MTHDYATTIEKELLEKLSKFRKNLQSVVRQNAFDKEMYFFKKIGLTHKISVAYDIATTLRRAKIRTGIGYSSTLPSYIYYLLNFIKTDPLEHEIIFEQIRENNPFLSIDFQVGENDRDRLLSILSMNYSATIKKGFSTKYETEYIAFIDFKGASESEFYRTGHANNVIQPNINSSLKTKFSFIFSQITAILQNCWYLISEEEAPIFHPDKIIMSKIKNYPRQKIVDFKELLALNNRPNLIRKIDFYQPHSLQELLNLVAITSSDENNNPISLKYLKTIREKKMPTGDAISYFCSDLVVNSNGVLFYKEQVYHILHHLCKISYEKAIDCFKNLKVDEKITKTQNYLINKMIKNNVPKLEAQEIIEHITENHQFLFSNLKFLPEAIKLHNFLYLLGNYPQQLAESIKKFI